MRFDCYVWDEVRDLPVDWESPIAWTDDLIAIAEAEDVRDTDRWKAFRLGADYRFESPRGVIEYRAAAIVLYDEHEVVLIEHSDG